MIGKLEVVQVELHNNLFEIIIVHIQYCWNIIIDLLTDITAGIVQTYKHCL